MPYTPNPEDVTQPADSGVPAGTAAAEFRALKAYLANLKSAYDVSIAALVAEVDTLQAEDSILTIPDAAYTVLATAHKKVLVFTSAVPAVVTYAAELPAGFTCTLIQDGAGQVSNVVAAGGTLHSRGGLVNTSAQYGVITARCVSNAGGAAAQIRLYGDLL